MNKIIGVSLIVIVFWYIVGINYSLFQTYVWRLEATLFKETATFKYTKNNKLLFGLWWKEHHSESFIDTTNILYDVK